MSGESQAASAVKMAPVALALLALSSTPAIAVGDREAAPEFTPIQHGTFVIQTSEQTIFVDPIGDAATFASFGAPDVILITDIHGDHLAPDVVQALATEATAIIGPKAVTDELGLGMTLKNGEVTTVGTTKIEATPMYNLAEDRLKFHEKGRGNGYLVTVDETRIYISGDTEDIPEMRALEDIDFAFVCMNLPYTMTVEQAADAVLAFKPKVVFPYHYRGQGGFSDVEEFKNMVGKDDSIEVRLLDWYE